MRVAEMIERFGGVCEGDASVEVHRITGIEWAGPGDATFALDEKNLAKAEAARAACVIVPLDLRASRIALVRCAAPQCYVARLMDFFHPGPASAPGIHPSAIIGPGTTIDESASIGPYVTIGAHCRLRPRVVLKTAVVLGDRCEVGADTVLHAHVTVYSGTRIGARVILHAGAVIGADGFGYFVEEGGLHKWPHIGNVVLEDDVEIGANTCVDRAKFGTTLIERGAKIDNLVQIAHNCHVGAGALLAGQTGLSGSVVVGAGAVLAGQVGIADHKTVGPGARIGAQSGIISDVPAGADVVGHPAKPGRLFFQETSFLTYLVENRAVLRRLIKAAGGL